MEHAIEIRDLLVERGGRTVLPGVSCQVGAGRITGLLGPSGGGKTTLMRCIVGVQRVRSGSVTVLGQPAGNTSLRRRVAYLTQAPSVYGDLTIGANLGYFAALQGTPRSAVAQALADVGLTGRADDRVDALSGGERTRASLACALIGSPELLVLDEPTVGLDPLLRRDLWQLMRGLAADGRTLVVSSHVMDEAARCDDLILLRDGRIVAADTPAGLLVAAGVDDMDEAFLRLAEHDEVMT